MTMGKMMSFACISMKRMKKYDEGEDDGGMTGLGVGGYVGGPEPEGPLEEGGFVRDD